MLEAIRDDSGAADPTCRCRCAGGERPSHWCGGYADKPPGFGSGSRCCAVREPRAGACRAAYRHRRSGAATAPPTPRPIRRCVGRRSRPPPVPDDPPIRSPWRGVSHRVCASACSECIAADGGRASGTRWGAAGDGSRLPSSGGGFRRRSVLDLPRRSHAAGTGCRSVLPHGPSGYLILPSSQGYA